MANKLLRRYWIVDFTEHIPSHDICKSKICAVAGYLFFMIPMVFGEDKQFARFHCNQALLNLILSTVVAVLLRMIPIVGAYLAIIQELLCIFFGIRGILLSIKGKARGIPLIGWITIVPYRLPGQ